MKQNYPKGKQPTKVVMNTPQKVRGKPIAFHPSMKQMVYTPGIGLNLGTSHNPPK